MKQQEQIHGLAFFDGLTKLPNRASFMQQSEQRFAEDAHAALLLIDLNDFKRVNDDIGHAAGDAILQATGKVLLRVAGNTHIPARLGGDEFVVYVRTEALDIPLALFVEHIRTSLEQEPVSFEEHRLHIQPSIGVAEKVPAMTFADFMHTADQNMYREKQRIKQNRS